MAHKILVVEDELEMNRQLCEFLANAGYETQGAHDVARPLKCSSLLHPTLCF